MKLFLLIAIVVTAITHWFSIRPNRGTDGKFARITWWERYGVYILLAVMAMLLLAGCAKAPSRTITGGSTSTVNESAQTTVPPSYPPAYLRRHVQYQSPAPTDSQAAEAMKATPATQPASNAYMLPPGWSFTQTDYYPPIPVESPTVLNRTTKTTTTTQPSTSVDIIAPENVGKAWAGICLLAAFISAVVATVTPLKRFYLIAGVAVGLAMIGLVPPVYIGNVFVGVSVVLLVVAGVYMYRTGMWQTTARQISEGAERVKKVVNGGEQFNTIMEAAQTVPKSYIRKAQGK